MIITTEADMTMTTTVTLHMARGKTTTTTTIPTQGGDANQATGIKRALRAAHHQIEGITVVAEEEGASKWTITTRGTDTTYRARMT